MKAKILFFLTFTLCLSISVSKTMPITLQKNPQTIILCFDSYNISSIEKIALYGAKRKHWINKNLYWGEAGYGAISGKRSGYLEGGGIVGFQTPIYNNWDIDLRLFYGAGGGGSAPQGGGMIIQPTISLGYDINYDLSIFIDLGYIKFLNGNISSYSLGFSVNWKIWEIFVEGEGQKGKGEKITKNE